MGHNFVMTHKIQNTYIFIRHGESDANARNCIASDLSLDTTHLTNEGRQQVVESTKKIRKVVPKVHHIISSPFLRTQETAQIIHSFFPHADLAMDSRLKERQMIQFEGKSIELMHAKIHPSNPIWTSKPHNIESYQEVFDRMYGWLSDYEESHTKTVCIVVSHAVPIKLILGWLDGYRGGYLSPYFPHMNSYNLQNAEYRTVSKRNIIKSAHITRLRFVDN